METRYVKNTVSKVWKAFEQKVTHNWIWHDYDSNEYIIILKSSNEFYFHWISLFVYYGKSLPQILVYY